MYVSFRFLFSSLLIATSLQVSSQIKIHSHNDYSRSVPFYLAYSQNASIIEADVFISENGKNLFVAHDREDIDPSLTIEKLYLDPIADIYKRNNGKMWKDNDNEMVLMIDLKTSYEKTLPLLIKKLNSYKGIFDNNQNNGSLRVVISGSMPNPSDFSRYPDYVMFDGRMDQNYDSEQLKRVYMISDSFSKYSKWNGKGIPIAEEREKLKSVIDYAHKINKPVRFWGTPEGITSWNTLYEMGVDVIGTKRLESCTSFFKDYNKKCFSLNNRNNENQIATYNRLDKATANFKGFNMADMNLDETREVYVPTFESDGSRREIKNVILLIGDGMGISQIGAANTINGDLSMLKLKQIGLMHTQAKDAFTTDSAGAGSSMATRKKNNNRHISCEESGEPVETITEVFAKSGKANGIVTLGNIADATPAAFYAHTTERDNSEEIINQINNGIINLICGSGQDLIKDKQFDNYFITESFENIDPQMSDLLCVDERMSKGTTKGSLNLLSDATGKAVEYLEQKSDKGFFLMVEGAKIDYAGHANSVPATIMEMLSFDLAVARALKFADSNNETLVIITGDHETGGLILIDGCENNNKITATFMTDDHTPAMLPVFAYGPYSDHFNGVYHNTEIKNKILNITSK